MFNPFVTALLVAAMASACSQAAKMSEGDIRVDARSATPIMEGEVPAPEAQQPAPDASPVPNQSADVQEELEPGAADPIMVGGAFLSCKSLDKADLFECTLMSTDLTPIAIPAEWLTSWRVFYQETMSMVPDVEKIKDRESYTVNAKGIAAAVIRMSVTKGLIKLSYDYRVTMHKAEDAKDSETVDAKAEGKYVLDANDRTEGSARLALGDGAYETPDFDKCSSPAIRSNVAHKSVKAIVYKFKVTKAIEGASFHMADICALEGKATMATLQGPGVFSTQRSNLLPEVENLNLYGDLKLPVGDYTLTFSVGASMDSSPDDFRFAGVVFANMVGFYELTSVQGQ